jgi:hypothetical protein
MNRIYIEGLDNYTSWQDLKDFARRAGHPMFTDVFHDRGGKVDLSSCVPTTCPDYLLNSCLTQYLSWGRWESSSTKTETMCKRLSVLSMGLFFTTVVFA